LAVVGIAAVIYSPFHYSWRWRQNEEQYQHGRIIKDDWVGGQVFIPIESWGLGALGAGAALFAGWQGPSFGHITIHGAKAQPPDKLYGVAVVFSPDSRFRSRR